MTRRDQLTADPATVEEAPAVHAVQGAGEDLRGAALHRAVWALAWPAVATMLLQTVNSLMDALFVGHLPNSDEALAAAGVGGQVYYLLVGLAMGVSVAATALVARFTGAEDADSADRALGQCLSLATVLGIACGAVVYFLRGPIADLLIDAGRNPHAAALCAQFLIGPTLATPLLFVMTACVGAYRGLGDTRTPLLVTLSMIAVHMTFDVGLIYGRFHLPRLGVPGAGYALTLSIVVGTVAYLVLLKTRSPLSAAFRRRYLAPQRDWTVRILRLGIPAAFQAVARTLSLMSFTGMLERTIDGETGLAALQVGIRSEAVAFMPGFGYSVAASALVGQSLGARAPERAARAGWAATAQAVVVMSGVAVLYFVFAHRFSALFSADPRVQYLGADYLRVAAASEPFLAISMVMMGALQGAGDTLNPTWITVVTQWAIRLPLAWVLMFPAQLAVHGAWLAMTLSTVIGGFMVAAVYRAGRWQRIRV